MAAAKVVWQVTCPTCRKGAPQGSPYCDSCGTPLHNVPAAPIDLQTAQVPVLDQALKKFLNEEQDPVLVKQIYEKASQILLDDEEIEYIATANRTVVGIAFDCVVATNRRLIDYKKKILGKVVLDDCFWRDVRDLEMKEVRHGVSLIVETIQGWRLTVESLPRAQAWRLYGVGAEYNPKLRMKLQEMLEEARAQEQDIPTLEAESALPVPAQQESVSGSEPAIFMEPLTVEPEETSSATGPLPSLPSVMPPTMEPFPMQGWQVAPTMQVDTPQPMSSSMESALTSLSGLDDLFAPMLEKPASRQLEEVAERQPAPMSQMGSEPLLFDGHSWEQPVGKSVAGSHLVSYQVGALQPPFASASNGSNGNKSNGSNGNGSHSLPILGSLLTVEASRVPEVELPLAVPPATASGIPPSGIPHAQESKPIKTPPRNSSPETMPDEHRRVSAPHESPMRKLRQLKRMLDVGLITQEDYEAKKADILSRI